MVIRKRGVLILTLFLGVILTACSKIMYGLYGLTNPAVVDEKVIASYQTRYSIPFEDGYQIDTAYNSFLFSLNTLRYKAQIKNHYQPLQALYYDRVGQMQSFQINCYAGGFPNLLWDRDHILTTFPPLQQAPIDSILPLNTVLKYLRPLTQTSTFIMTEYDYVVVIFWNRFMSKQSERFIHFIQDNSKLAKNKKVKILYVNDDNLFAISEINKK